MKIDQDEEELLDSSPTDELPVLSEYDVIEDFDRTSIFVSLHDDTGRHSTARLPSVEAPAADTLTDTVRALEHRGTDTYQVGALREDPAIAQAVRPEDGAYHTTDRAEAAGTETLQARLDELTALHADLHAEAADKDASIASLRERLEATRQAVLRRDETELGLRAQLAQLQTRLTEHEDLLAEHASRIQDSADRLASADAQLAERDGRLDEAASGSAELEARLTELGARLTARDAELGDRDARLAALAADLIDREAQLGAQSDELAARHAELIDRDEQLEALTSALTARDARLANLEAELTERDARIAAQERHAEDRERELAKLEAEREQAKQHLQEARDTQAALQRRMTEREQLDENTSVDSAATTNGAPSDAMALRRSREEAATLASYIENRRAHWDEMQERLIEQRERMNELELELEQRTSRQREAVQRAAAESERVAELKTEVGKLRRLLDARRRDRAPMPMPVPTPTPTPTHSAVDSDSSAAPPQMAAATSAPRVEHAADDDSGKPAIAVDQDTGTAPTDGLQTQLDPLNRELDELRAELTPLRRELDALREELDPLRAELAAREETLRERDDQQNDLQQKLADSQAQLDQARKAVGRLERIVIERDRALDVKNTRINSLHTELAEKLGAAAAYAAAGHDETALPENLEAPATISGVASMVCLTDDAPRSYPLRKPVITIGRSSLCDIQIATHFVSREHARIAETPDGPVIEDLGSKNGVFVNSVRVEREPLKHGDLVTIGETQFRFLRE